jgi:hypothetical protein
MPTEAAIVPYSSAADRVRVGRVRTVTEHRLEPRFETVRAAERGRHAEKTGEQ